MHRFSEIFKPIDIGALHLKNRIMMAPCVTFFAKNGYVNDQMIEFYRERARGGVSLVIIEATYPCFSGRSKRLFLFDDKFIPGLAKLAEAIHQEGAKAALQLNPPSGKDDEDHPIYVSLPGNPPAGARELSKEDIEGIIRNFGEGCRRAEEANFDAIQVHGSSGFLIYQFLSPIINRRKDLYGGVLENRARFALDLVREAKKRLKKIPLLFRMSADDHMYGGFGLPEAQLLAKLLQEAGVDSIDVTSGARILSFEYLRPGMFLPRGYNVPYAEAIKKKVQIPVSVAGSITDPFHAEEILKKGQADLISLCRPLIADPHFVKKTAEGRTSEICKCILCNQGCTEYAFIHSTPLLCSVNPLVGKEGDPSPSKAAKTKEVLVVGGGPGGLWAAVTAAKRGHRVTLLEKNGTLGGNLWAASGVFFKREILQLQNYLVREIEKSTAQVVLGQEADFSLIEKIHPQVLILATGSRAAFPAIPGIDRKNVSHAADVLSGKYNPEGRVIVVGGGMMGVEAAVFLRGRGKDVILVSLRGEEQLGLGMESRLRHWFLSTLWPEMRIPFYSYKKCIEITEEGLVIKDEKRGGQVTLLKGKTVVFCLGMKADSRFNVLMSGLPAEEIHKIGDCVRPRNILEAIHEGYRVAQGI